MTYRGAARSAGDSELIATAEHSVLGTRWIYDGPSDPVWVGQLLQLVADEGVSGPGGRPRDARARGLRRSQADPTAMATSIELRRVLTAGPVPAEPGIVGVVMGSWQPDGCPPDCHVHGCLAVVRELGQAPGMTRLVVKLGSSSIASGDGLALDVIANLVTQIAGAQRDGHQVVLVTSGAARLGRRLLSFEGPTARAGQELQRLVDVVRTSVSQDSASATVSALTATLDRYDGAGLSGPVGLALAASVGQPALMAIYRQLAAAVGVEVCQILLSKSDLDSARAMRDVGAVLVSALNQGLLPVVNGNDTTDPRSELDNDQIAVAVAVASQASRLTFLTNVAGVYTDGQLRDRISRLTPQEARAVRSSTASEGRGGMKSKLHAAARAAYCGIECSIGSARDTDVVARSLSAARQGRGRWSAAVGGATGAGGTLGRRDRLSDGVDRDQPGGRAQPAGGQHAVPVRGQAGRR